MVFMSFQWLLSFPLFNEKLNFTHSNFLTIQFNFRLNNVTTTSTPPLVCLSVHGYCYFVHL